ncbi:E3 binding domain-containing protein [Roseivivax sp. GX 12232]|uniref:E3 binding domain-containing protein n=1 Tax=Roseivivax sp. GX 12232 TaxID=2900547 RepID=UPI001E4E259F|nr:E3 binding domain-containing protein [Roseivivax sp. GX 12232]MCE0504357.1 E3 binding domain-containing protein [Roseivivax sp. GX 12232]
MSRVFASPYARHLAKARGIDLAGLRGSGPGGRIVAADLEKAAEVAAAAQSEQAQARVEPAQAPSPTPGDLPPAPAAILRRSVETAGPLSAAERAARIAAVAEATGAGALPLVDLADLGVESLDPALPEGASLALGVGEMAGRLTLALALAPRGPAAEAAARLLDRIARALAAPGE